MTTEPTDDDHSPIRRDYAAGSDAMVIVFSGLKRRPEGVPNFSFMRVLEGLPVQKLYVRDLHRAWFLRGLPGWSRNVAETAAFLAREIREQGVRRVIVSGYSLGGFAAVLFGHLLQAEVVHAFSPQTFISLPLRCWHRDHRWQRWVLKLHASRALFAPRDLKPLLSRSPARSRFVLHYAADSPLDVVHARRLEGLPGVSLQEHAQGRHRLVTALRDSGQLRQILEGALRAQR